MLKNFDFDINSTYAASLLSYLHYISLRLHLKESVSEYAAHVVSFDFVL